MKKTLIVTIAMTTLLFGKMTNEQKDNCKLAYDIAKPFDLGNTLAGIAYVESKCGLYKVNPLSGDYGLTQINLKTALNRLKLKNNFHNRNSLPTMLVTNDILAIELAILELIYWRDTSERTNWRHYVSSYNQGNVIKSQAYVDKVAEAIKLLKQQGVLDD